MATILITGGTGMIGRALTRALLERDHRVIILTRQSGGQNEVQNNLSYAHWDINRQIIDKKAVTGADYIIHLAGAGVADKRWTKKRKQEIVDSRVKGGELLARALKGNTHSIKAVITSSGIGWYGQDPEIPNAAPFVETDPADTTFLGTTCQKWEGSLASVREQGIRLVILRTGIVLSTEAGALPEFERPLKFGIAAILGRGNQIMSWIHIEDLVRIYIMAIENDNISGVYNAVAPGFVSNKALTLELARIKRRRFFAPIHVPSFVLKAVLGELSIEVLKSATVSCAKIQNEGFDFKYPSISGAMSDLLK